MKNSAWRALIKSAFPLLIALFVTASVSLGQSGTTGVSGTVRDKNGAAVPGVTVKISNPQTGFERTVTTNEEGTYNFNTILPATYKIEFEAKGFKKVV
ncbi:MAG TPA: carboxypeptidase-like regulatory domain-containing protein, partial [Pyrinomonadaceae bacterium]|nr:carboxypeptidase-like regulatory domain-containing protein [Pyrinomonadaceae bacterium]